MADPQRLMRRLVPWLGDRLDELLGAHRAGRLGHAWILHGPDALGNLNLALNAALRLADESARGEPPDTLTAQDARAVVWDIDAEFDHHPDFHWIRPAEGKTAIGVEQVRETTGELHLRSFGGAAKAVVIEPADAMTLEACNALLKTLEEPTDDTYLILVTTRPSRLPATVRSRCQFLSVPVPRLDVLEAWIGTGGLEALARHAGPEPLSLLAAADEQKAHRFEEFGQRLGAVYEGRMDPQMVAEEWSKLELNHVLAWLVRRLQLVIRERAAAARSNRVTDSPGEFLHNAFGRMTIAQLFGQLDRAERLREQVGSGINTELGLRMLLMGFGPDGNRK